MLSSLINTHLLLAARRFGVSRYFSASSAWVYSAEMQKFPNLIPLKENNAYPAMPEDGFGWEELLGEKVCRHFHEDLNLNIARV